ncbi:MerR family transcriptional regulator [Cryptosporangium arvum]|uniref:Putative transcriptional regulator n=1 Tax=Cryptosporangium arvum DSM 44712 TaxID=927661 RepID=A0A011AJ52_9ACTN|nr:MerR family transcriptional regulator [Cryptosporangium arvum]EXG82056.1 putative transcriptional regulator [Cryptosporangium arvum DSM 44712]
MVPIQEVARRSGLSEATLRYYERIGLIAPVPRDESSGHRRYDEDTAQAIEALACLRTAGMGIADMRAYLRGMSDGPDAARQQAELFEKHAAQLAEQIETLRSRQRYLDAKVLLWRAREHGDRGAEEQAIDAVTRAASELR